MNAATRGMTRPQRLLGAAAVVLVLGAALVYLAVPGRGHRVVIVDFPSTVGLYAGDDVRMLGVPIGSVVSLTPEQNSVRVGLSYRSDVVLPADVHAAILAPTLVTGRFVQLSPVYRGGPQLADGAEIPVERTAVPVEWDEIEKQLVTLTGALGPDGANQDGALSRVLNTAAANLDGQGGSLHDTLTQLSQAATTLSDGRSDLFGTIRNLQVFFDALAQNDRQVQDFNTQLASVSQVLADNSDELSTTLTTLNSTLPLVQKFVADNRNGLATDLDKLGQVTTNLAQNRQALADVLQVAPTSLANFNNIYDPLAGSLTGVLSTANVKDPAAFVCTAIFAAGGTPDQCRQAIAPLADLVAMDDVPVTASPLERNGRSAQSLPDGASPPGDSPGPGAVPGLENLLAPGGSR
ncbi:MAG: phospholipid/cholesterol/gamma-HCH transport system substrate-binding protein [Pseudonocardiales bacterium]|nr:phospholipid/cholesterol/gamma-HCH transport system substrate-binding protein [Pseudonocardiales bacterium]